MKKIPLLVESDNGHDVIDVPVKDLPGEVEKQLRDDKWVTLAKTDGSTEVLTKTDIPVEEEDEEEEAELSEEDKKLQKEVKKKSKKEDGGDWKNAFSPTKSGTSSVPKPTKKDFVRKFKGVTSATANEKSRGG